MGLQHQQILCNGQTVWAFDMQNGTHRCACGQILRLVTTDNVVARLETRPSERRIAGFDPDHRAEELEARDRDLSRVDFEQPFEAA